MGQTVAERLAAVEARIARACTAAGRERGAVRLLAASKQQPLERVRAALEAGQVLLGESRAQSLRERWATLGSDPRPRWHFIGPLQRNKVRLVVGRVEMIQTVDRMSLAKEIDRRIANTGAAPVDVLIEVNLHGEATKAGAAPGATLALAAEVGELAGVRVRGLMAIPRWSGDADLRREGFRALAELAAEGRAQGLPMTELSMGMTADLEDAIAEGATIVRVGTGIFGPRG